MPSCHLCPLTEFRGTFSLSPLCSTRGIFRSCLRARAPIYGRSASGSGSEMQRLRKKRERFQGVLMRQSPRHRTLQDRLPGIKQALYRDTDQAHFHPNQGQRAIDRNVLSKRKDLPCRVWRGRFFCGYKAFCCRFSWLRGRRPRCRAAGQPSSFWPSCSSFSLK